MSTKESSLDVYCFCAAWCGICREIQPAMEAFDLAGFQLHWVDIEDHSDAMEEIEIQTFPTIVVTGRDTRILFAGPIEPRMGNLTRLLEALSPAGPTAPDHECWTAVITNLQAAGVGQPTP